MQVRFYTNSKRHNSTKIPTGGATYSCVLKDQSSKANPIIALKWDGSGDPTSYNQCWIGAYNKYYWIDNWTYADRQWVASCSYDVLATYKQQIAQSSKYVLRSASEYNEDIADTKYPAKTDVAATYGTIDQSLNWAASYNAGTIIAGIVGQGNTLSPGGVGYVSMSPATFQTLLTNLFTESGNTWSSGTSTTNFGDALREFGEKITKSVTNPFQFINSVRWYPFSVGGTAFNAKLGMINTNVSVNAISLPTSVQFMSFTFDSMSNGSDGWMNLEPFTEYTLDFPPFGVFSIPASLMLGCSSLVCVVETDLTTGLAELTVYSQPDSVAGMQRRILRASGKVGIDIQIAGNNVGILGGLQSGISAIGGIAAAVAAPGIGSIASAISGVGSAAGSLAPQSISSGAQGSLAGIFRMKELWIRHRTPVDQDVTEQGRPLCEVKTLGSLSGYIQCADGELDVIASPEEHAQLAAFLTGGFFYE